MAQQQQLSLQVAILVRSINTCNAYVGWIRTLQNWLGVSSSFRKPSERLTLSNGAVMQLVQVLLRNCATTSLALLAAREVLMVVEMYTAAEVTELERWLEGAIYEK